MIIKLTGDMIYVNASYRRTILDAWVYLQQGGKKDVIEIRKKVKKGMRFENVDLEYWANKNR